MTGRQRKTRGTSQGKFKTSCDSKKGKSKCRGDFTEHLNKVIGSWLNFKHYIYGESYVEVETLKNISPDLFKTKQFNVKTEHKLARSHGRKKENNLWVIDLDKLNGNLSLSNNEKETLKQILGRLKYNKRDTKLNKSDTKRSAVNKPRDVFSKDRKRSRRKNYQPKTKQKEKEFKKAKGFSATTVCSECQREQYLKKSHKITRERLKKSITSSQEKILKTLIDLDSKSLTPSQRCNSSSSISGIFGESQSININNIEFKYLNPTYLVQYNNTNDSEDFNMKRDRLFSNAALGAHLGQGRMTIHERRDHEHLPTTMHYDNLSDRHVVGLGQGTEQMIRERQSQLRSDRTSSCVSDPGIPYPRFPLVKRYDFDLDDDELSPTSLNSHDKTYRINPQIKLLPIKNKGKTYSTCSKFKTFLKKCLCMTTGRTCEPNSKPGVFQGRPDKNKLREQRHKFGPNYIRTTEEEFFDSREMDNKQVTFDL